MGDHAPREMTVRASHSYVSFDRTRLNGSTTLSPLSLVECRGLIFAQPTACKPFRPDRLLKPDQQMRQTTFCLSVFLFAGCVRQVAPSEEVSPAGIPTSKSSDSTATLLRPFATLYAPGTVHYRYEATSVTQSIAGDSIPRIDSVRVMAVLSATFQAGSSPQLVQAITQADSIRLTSMPNVGVAGARVELSQRGKQQDTLEIDRTTGRARAKQHARSCDQETIDPMFRGDEIIPAIPERVPVSKTWADTLTRQSCRGGIPLRVTQIARYELAPRSDGDSAASYRIIRVTETQVSGTGIQWQQSVEASGHGITTDTLTISQHGAPRLQRVATTSRAEIGFRSARRNQQFIQTVTSQIVMRP